MKKRDRRKRQTITAQAASKLSSTETSKELARPLRRYAIWKLSALCAFVVTVLGIWSLSAPSQTAIKTANPRLRATQPKESVLPTFADLTKMTEEELSKQDIALLNPRATDGLPGTENVNVAELLAQLDGWAKKVRIDTDRNLYQFLQKPNEFNNSEAYFRMLMLVTVLQQDFGVHYNLERVNDIDFTKSQDLFIHGMVGSSNGGTCVSMPVLYTAVARRLGYPPYPVGNPNAGPILWPEAIDNWLVNDFENGNEKCSCKSLQGNRMRPTSPATGKAPPVAGLPWADCKIGESVMVRYQSSCEPDNDLPCNEPCEASICWEYVCYKCKPRRVTPNSKFPEITTQWSKCDDDRGDTKKSKCSL
jgi:hypothetical protein